MRIVDVASDGATLAKDRGFLVDLRTGRRTPLEDVDVVMVSSWSGSLGIGLLRWAADAGVPVVLCDEKFHPSGLFLPLVGTLAHPSVLADQIDASVPAKKRFWASIVRVKIAMQAQALRLFSLNDASVRKWAKLVRSGDPENREATAAAAYFSLMFGPGFRRGRDSAVNRHLDYGYAVARAATARGAVAVGLHPSLSIHHSSTLNAFALVDDLMEPFRAVVDAAVRLHDCSEEDLLPACKSAVIAHLTGLLKINHERIVVADAMRAVAAAWRATLREGGVECPSIMFDEAQWSPTDTETCG
ncbi:MAG: type II CRISPR-associated endonuclease Cas1 [Candidatus Eremiobacteraeota bacterium]|nr:type II CRISPR-associated endonuclease Cas1 [Candidatus Eremiobacteraeota bacterium]